MVLKEEVVLSRVVIDIWIVDYSDVLQFLEVIAQLFVNHPGDAEVVNTADYVSPLDVVEVVQAPGCKAQISKLVVVFNALVAVHNILDLVEISVTHTYTSAR